MVYYCENKTCGLAFERTGEVESCPKCSSPQIRHASELEKAVFKNRQESDKILNPDKQA